MPLGGKVAAIEEKNKKRREREIGEKESQKKEAQNEGRMIPTANSEERRPTQEEELRKAILK